MSSVYDHNRAEQQINNCNKESGGWYGNRKAKCSGNPVLTHVNELIDVYRSTIVSNAPRCKNKFKNSIGNDASSQSTRRCEYPLVYRFMLDVFQVENVKLLRMNDYTNVGRVMKFLVENIAQCWWPTAFFDKKISDDKDVLMQEWKRNVEVNPYFNLVNQARTLVGQH